MLQRLTAPAIRGRKGGTPISVLTAYDISFARVLDRTGLDILLVGDSLAQAMLGYSSTLPVTMDEMLMHVAAVSRGTLNALVVADMPFLSYQASASEAMHNAGRFLKEAGAQAVKLEGGRRMADTVRALTEAGIPVMGHLGMTPQSVQQFGGPRLQAKEAEAAEALVADARALEDAGAFSVVLEVIPWQVARRVTESVSIPTIGIGAGPYCDGQVLVMHDLLGLGDHLTARFCPAYADLNAVVTDAVCRWKQDVEAGRFPTLDQSYTMPAEEVEKLNESGSHSG
jgi:3-methyl-2-oxobutanoate hydroxymethyltransferase